MRILKNLENIILYRCYISNQACKCHRFLFYLAILLHIHNISNSIWFLGSNIFKNLSTSCRPIRNKSFQKFAFRKTVMGKEAVVARPFLYLSFAMQANFTMLPQKKSYCRALATQVKTQNFDVFILCSWS